MTQTPATPGCRGSGRRPCAREYSIEQHLCFANDGRVIEDIYAGLRETPKRIASLHFYDSVGSKLFEEITALPEYYLTRTEKGLLASCSPSWNAMLADHDVVEIGSGDCSKISIILRALSDECRASVRYVPVDVSRPAIEDSACLLLQQFPGLRIHGVMADFVTQMHAIPHARKRCFLFLGSTVGNLSREQARVFFASLGSVMRRGEVLVLGADRVKETAVLERAYNDARGVTAQFNRNILRVVNRRAGTDFDPDAFEHVARYNEEGMRIEMHLRAARPMVVRSPHFPRHIAIEKGELIHTENSHKFTDDEIAFLARAGGLTIEAVSSDADKLFSLVRMRKCRKDMQ